MQKIASHETATILTGLTCPQCDTHNYKRNGKRKNIQRYQCKTCGKTFMDTHQTALHGLHKKHLIDPYIQCMKQGMTIRQSAKTCGISVPTAFQWRHKLLASLATEINQQTRRTTKTIATIQIPYSQKGSRNKTDKHPEHANNLIISNQSGNSTIIQLQNGGHSKEIRNQLRKIDSSNQTEIIQNQTILKNALRATGNITENKTNKKTISYHLKAIQETENSLKQWLDKFRGVATKYLQQYWNWCTYNQDNQSNHFRETLLQNRNLHLYRKITSAS